MMINLADVKQFNTYTYNRAVDPTSTEKAPNYLAGQTWLNTVTGESFQLTDQTLGTWTQIELDTDAQITARIPATCAKILRTINNPCFVPRNEPYDDADGYPENQYDEAVYALIDYESEFSECTFDASAGISRGADVYGGITFQTDDIVYIKSRRNNGFFTVSDDDGSILEVVEPLKAETAFTYLFLVIIPPELVQILARIVHYEIFTQPSQTGVKSETIGTYSYTLKESSSGMLDYPSDILTGLSAFEGGVIGGKVNRVI